MKAILVVQEANGPRLLWAEADEYSACVKCWGHSVGHFLLGSGLSIDIPHHNDFRQGLCLEY